jgi:hypothetical protein
LNIQMIRTGRPVAEIMCLLCNTFFVPHSGTAFLTLHRRRSADRLRSRGWAKRFIPIYFEPGGAAGHIAGGLFQGDGHHQGSAVAGGARMGATNAHVNFRCASDSSQMAFTPRPTLHRRHWPISLVDGTLGECLREFMAKPASMRHLYEIHTSPQPPLVSSVLSGGHVVELARLRDFL